MLLGILPLMASAADATTAADFRAEEDRRSFADALFSRGLHKQAAIEYQRLLRDFPSPKDVDVVQFRLGECLRLSGDRVNAILAYKPVTENLSSQWRDAAMFKRATLFLELNQPEAAEELLRILLEAKPKAEVREMALYYHSATLEAMGQNGPAITELEALLKEFPKGPMSDYARLALGRLYNLPGPSRNEARALELLQNIANHPTQPRLGAEAIFLLASHQYANQQYPAAADGFARLFREYPDDLRIAEARFPAAWSYCKGGRAQEAIALADTLLAAAPPPAPDVAVELRYVRAQSLFQLSRFEESARAFSEIAADPAAQANGFAPRAAYQAALCHFKRNAYAACQEAVRPVLENVDTRSEGLWLFAEAASLEGTNAWDNAIEGYSRLIAEYPDSGYIPDALFRLGSLHQKRGYWLDASVAYHTLAERFPRSELAPRALFASAASLAKAGQGAKALLDWMTFLRDYPDHEAVPEALFQQGTELIRENRYLEALNAFDRLLREHPENPRVAEAWYWRGALLRESNDLPASIDAFRKCLAANPSDAVRRDARFALALALQAHEQDAEAAAIFQELLNDPVRERFTSGQLRWLAEYQYRRGQFAEAAQTARHMVGQSDDDLARQIGWTLVGRAERAANHAAEAEAAFRAACDLPVTSTSAPEATIRLAQLLLDRGDNENAARYFTRAVTLCATPELQPFRIHAYVGLGRAALAQGQKELALRYWMTTAFMYHEPEVLPPIIRESIALAESLGKTEEAESLRKTLAEYN